MTEAPSLIARLRDIGELTPEWEEAFASVPRAAFLPEVMWPFDLRTGRSAVVDRRDDPAEWQDAAERDEPIITQWDDGQHTGTAPGSRPTSSSSAPRVVAEMLATLDVQPGDRVLEVGAGTGWNAALLAHRAGPRRVVTVEVDPAVAEAARKALARCGSDAEVVIGDGLAGHPEGAPYDRLMATFGVRRVPGIWVSQVRAGGVLVVPWGTDFGPYDGLARLVVADDGRFASGSFHDLVEFMKARSQRTAVGQDAYVPEDIAGRSDRTKMSLPGGAFEKWSTERFVVGLRVSGVRFAVAAERKGFRPAWCYSLTDQSWAVAALERDRTEHSVYQAGPRRLWDEVAAAYAWWEDAGRPDVWRFGLTVEADGRQRVWLDEDGNGVG